MQVKLAHAASQPYHIEREASGAGDAAEANGLGQEIGGRNDAGEGAYRICASDWRKCPQSNVGPGSVLRPGAMSACPTTSTIGYRSRRTTRRSARREY